MSERIEEIYLKWGDNRCAYCNRQFDFDMLITPVVHEHFIPAKVIKSNRLSNLLLSCHPCNNSKQDKVFKTIEEARQFIRYHKWSNPQYKIEELLSFPAIFQLEKLYNKPMPEALSVAVKIRDKIYSRWQ